MVCTLHERTVNEGIRDRNGIVCNLNGVVAERRYKWTRHLLRMNETHISKLVYEYIPVGRRNAGSPSERWTDLHPWRRNKPALIPRYCPKYYHTSAENFQSFYTFQGRCMWISLWNFLVAMATNVQNIRTRYHFVREVSRWGVLRSISSSVTVLV